MEEISLFRSITRLKCPKCRKGNLFIKPGLFSYKQILTMPDNCQNCGQKFEIEPGFWLGALWMSYPFIIIIITPFILLAISGVDLKMWAIVLTMIFSMAVFFPLSLRLGRSIWIHIFVRYKI
jgi:uncharacterized protein (DUF983 family)